MKRKFFISFFLAVFALASPALASDFQDTINVLEGSLEEAGEYGNSEIKYYSGDLGVFLRLPQYSVMGEPEVLSFTYRSNTVDPYATVSVDQEFLHYLNYFEFAAEFDGRRRAEEFEAFTDGLDRQNELGYLFKALFSAKNLKTGFYPSWIKFTYYKSLGICPPCAKIPLIGRFFEGYQTETQTIE
ncbi:MAG: hypothetical protein HY466_02555, partial [Deltaproteobacteria bacterium]|nr:hypothetical protein [Deltaproteobacteria bacterium]